VEPESKLFQSRFLAPIDCLKIAALDSKDILMVDLHAGRPRLKRPKEEAEAVMAYFQKSHALHKTKEWLHVHYISL
jgi:hypothetical protein